MNNQQQAFMDTLAAALKNNSFKRVTFSAREKGDDKFKASFDLIIGGSKNLIRHTTSTGRMETTNLDISALLQKLGQEPYASFRAASLFTQNKDYHYAENRKGEPRFYDACKRPHA
ncbi:MAG: hypothetical protein U5K75_10415 [Ahrensia sp.]|nr:hypothetical protein [Ahrensia sp.]